MLLIPLAVNVDLGWLTTVNTALSGTGLGDLVAIAVGAAAASAFLGIFLRR